MSLAPHLPEEILEVILSLVMRVPDELFHSTCDDIPRAFSPYPESLRKNELAQPSEKSELYYQSQLCEEPTTNSWKPRVPGWKYLTVCWQWRRLGIKLLYHTVILRSKAQASVLASTLTASTKAVVVGSNVKMEHGTTIRIGGRSSSLSASRRAEISSLDARDLSPSHADPNRAIGCEVRRLRIDGAFGPGLRAIVRLCPRVEELSMAVWFRASQDTKHLAAALADDNARDFMNPARLTLNAPWGTNIGGGNGELVHEALARCLSLWTNLRHITLTSIVVSNETSPNFRDALVEAAQVTMLEFTDTQPSVMLFNFVERCIAYELDDQAVASRTISVRFRRRNADVRVGNGHETALCPISVKSRLTVFSCVSNNTCMGRYPFANASLAVQNNIWTRVLRVFFQTIVTSSTYRPSTDLMQVCKQWKIIVQRLCFEAVVLSRDAKMKSLLRHFVSSTAFDTALCGLPLQTFEGVIKFLTNLRKFEVAGLTQVEDDIVFDSRAFDALQRATSDTLETLTITIGDRGADDPIVLPIKRPVFSFSTLHTMNIRTHSECSELMWAEPCCLPALRNVTLAGSRANMLLDSLAQSELPSLRFLNIVHYHHGGSPDAVHRFCMKHGYKIRTLMLKDDMVSHVLPHCSNTETISFRDWNEGGPVLPAPSNFLSMVKVYPALLSKLRILELPFLDNEMLNHKSQSVKLDTWAPFLLTIGRAKQAGQLPSFAFVRLKTNWPGTDHDAMRSKRPLWAQLLTRFNISMVDLDGRRWVERLSTRGVETHLLR
ncbi:hypothetical protein BKA62DRAFT_719759 [Auriculariales sp. MPI-PUGE-AT-0066]|nr:hypothetical protein BKA62DRAFT_719759 [Auriculariales sp. MPI-PUGE-AT-0066]